MNWQMPPQIIALATPLRLGASLLNPSLSQELRQDLLARVGREGKFSKAASLYMPVTIIPPVAWRYDCADCVFYRPGTRSCNVVEGIIEPYAWCGLWVNDPWDPPFSWLARALGGG